ncbi:MAG: DUF4339 domain-containing protein, partial [Myxococcales bacterium]|nr:DUF4339 domain-containing protein [Myxococcales bacterium]
PRPAPPPRRAGSAPGITPSPGILAAREASRLSAPTVVGSPPQELLKKNNGAAAHALADFEDTGFDEDERTVVASVGGLAASFAQSVTAPESAPLSTLSTPSDEWYVGINGVPVGPIRLSELRSKASAGTITLDSLVWRDGFEEWISLRTFPELVAIVEEGVSSARASLTPLSPHVSSPPVAPVPAPKPEVYDPFAMPSAPAAGALADPFGAPAAPPPAAAVPQTGPAVVTERALSESEFVIPKRSGTPIAAWIAVAAALICGLGIGFVLFDREKPSDPIVKYVEVPAKDPGKGTAANPESTAEAQNPEATDDAGTKAVAGKAGTAGGVAKAGTPATADTTKKGGLTGLSGLSGLSGPGPTGGPSGDNGAQAHPDGLDGATIQKTVSRYTGSVKRSCWQPALDTRAKDAPSSARVSVTIHVAPSGSVSSVSSSGDPKGYRGLASCITSRVRAWQFPAAGAPTTVNVPFVFAAQ